MSTLFGIAALGDAPVQMTQLLDMERALAHRPCDATGHHVTPHIALGLRQLSVMPEVFGHELPHRDRAAGLVCAFDGRLDEREQLAETLRVSRALGDEALLCAAYTRWGTDAVSYLLGDFAFALYDEKERRLILARDAYGVRALYWARTRDTLLFASQASALFAPKTLEKRIEPLRVAQYLARDFAGTERSFFRDVMRLPPGQMLILERGELTQKRHFTFDLECELQLSTSHEYAERFRELLIAAVRTRLRASGPVGCMLSGGLDSSAVLGAMRDLAPGRDIPCFSARFPSMPELDEGPWLALHHQRGAAPRHDLAADQLGPLDDIERVYDELDEPFHAPNLFIYRALARLAHERGVSVLLDGLDGDTVVEHGVYFLAELFARGRLRRFSRELRALSRRMRLSYGAVLGAWAFAPFADRVSAHLGQLGFARQGYLADDFAHDSGFLEHARAQAELQLSTPLRFRALHFRAVTAPIVPFYLEVHDKIAAAQGVDHRHPFFDRRLIQFCLALPPDQRLHDGWDRVIQRRALRGLVPDAIRARQSKSVWTLNFQTQLFTRHEDLIASVIDDPATPLAPFCDLERLRSDRARLAVGSRPERVHDLWTAVTLGLWLRRNNAH